MSDSKWTPPWSGGKVHDRLNDTSAGPDSVSGCVNVDTPVGPRCAHPDHWRAPTRYPDEPAAPGEPREAPRPPCPSGSCSDDSPRIAETGCNCCGAKTGEPCRHAAPREAPRPELYRKRPVVVEAVLFRAGEQPGELAADVVAGRVCYPEDGTMLIQTLEGVMCAQPGDWIIRGVKGELYPCKPDIFDRTYEPAAAAPREPLFRCGLHLDAPTRRFGDLWRCSECGRPTAVSPSAAAPREAPPDPARVRLWSAAWKAAAAYWRQRAARSREWERLAHTHNPECARYLLRAHVAEENARDFAAQVQRWEDKEVARASNCCGAEARAESAEALLAAARERERALREALRELHATMIDLIEWQAVEHEDPTCPQDDTCECPRVRRIDAACHAASAALAEEGSPRGR